VLLLEDLELADKLDRLRHALGRLSGLRRAKQVSRLAAAGRTEVSRRAGTGTWQADEVVGKRAGKEASEVGGRKRRTKRRRRGSNMSGAAENPR